MKRRAIFIAGILILICSLNFGFAYELENNPFRYCVENCENIQNLFNKAVENSDFSYCDRIYEEKLSAKISQSGTSNYYYLTPDSLKNSCYEYIYFYPTKKEVCEGLGTRYYPPNCEEKSIDKCSKDSINHYKEICFKELSKTSMNPEDCEYMTNKFTKYECYKNVGSPKRFYYSFLINWQNFKEGLGMFLAFGAPWILIISSIISIITIVFIIRAIKNKSYLKMIISILIFLIFVSLTIFELYILIFFWPPHM